MNTIKMNEVSGDDFNQIQQDGRSLNANFKHLYAICTSKDNTLYVIDGHGIKMINHHHQVTTLAGGIQAGFNDGKADDALFNSPHGICISDDHKIYVADTGNYCIRMMYKGQVSTIAGGCGRGFRNGNAFEALFNSPRGICTLGEKIYVTDMDGIRVIEHGQVSTLAGIFKGFRDGNVTQALFSRPGGICISNSGKLYVADTDNHCIRMIYDGKVTTIAGTGRKGFRDGNVMNAMFQYPYAICISSIDERIYVVGNCKRSVRIIHKGQVSTIVCPHHTPDDRENRDPMFNYMQGICATSNGMIYVADSIDYKLSMMKPRLIVDHDAYTFTHAREISSLNDSYITMNHLTFHLNKKFIIVRCNALFDPACLDVIEKSNIAHSTLRLFLNYLYTHQVSKQWTYPATIDNVDHVDVELDEFIEFLFVLDVFSMQAHSELQHLIYENLKPLCDQESDVAIPVYLQLLSKLYKRIMIISSISTSRTNQFEHQEIPSTISTPLIPSKTSSRSIIPVIDDPNSFNYMTCVYRIILKQLKKHPNTMIANHLSELQSMEVNDVLVVMKDILSDQHDDQDYMLNNQTPHILLEMSKFAFEETNFFDASKRQEKSSAMMAWCKPDFVIRLTHDETHYHVHKFILCGRWRYFSLLLQSGLKEVEEGCMLLPEEWNLSRLQKWITYIYLNRFQFNTLEDTEWFMTYGSMYMMTETTNEVIK